MGGVVEWEKSPGRLKKVSVLRCPPPFPLRLPHLRLPPLEPSSCRNLVNYILICSPSLFSLSFLRAEGTASTLYPSVPIDTWCEVVLKCLLMEALRDNYAKNFTGNSKDSSHSGGHRPCNPHQGAYALSTTQEQRIQKDWVKEEGGHYPRMITLTSPGQSLFRFLCSSWSADPDVVPDYTDPLRKMHSVLTNSYHLLSIPLDINTSFTDREVISLSKARS